MNNKKFSIICQWFKGGEYDILHPGPLSQSEVDNFIENIEFNLPDYLYVENITIIEYKEEISDWYYELTEEQKESIERGIKDIEEGRIYTNEEVNEQVKNLLKNYRNI